MITIQQYRLVSTTEETISALYIIEPPGLKKFQCWILEDQFQPGEKVYGETRIPEGTYELCLRKFGRFHGIYKERYPDFHIGMIELMDVHGFTDILFHCGNRDKDTKGCLLPGLGINSIEADRYELLNSTAAYKKVYKKIAPEILNGKVRWSIYDFDRE